MRNLQLLVISRVWTSGMLRPVLGSPAQERNGTPGMAPAEDNEDD